LRKSYLYLPRHSSPQSDNRCKLYPHLEECSRQSSRHSPESIAHAAPSGNRYGGDEDICKRYSHIDGCKNAIKVCADNRAAPSPQYYVGRWKTGTPAGAVRYRTDDPRYDRLHV
jgi:hypothetical protein